MQSKTVRSSITAAVSNIIGSQKTKQWGLTWINIGFSCYLATRVLFTWKSWQNLESLIFVFSYCSLGFMFCSVLKIVGWR